MKPLIILLLLLCLSLIAFGQQATPEYPDSGFTNKAEAKNQFVNKLKEGKWIDYMGRDGDTDNYMLTVYLKGIPIGISRIYINSTGKIWLEKPYVNGMENGIEKMYDSFGKLVLETPYVNDSANGVQKRYYSNGKILCKTVYKNNIGTVPQYYKKDGTPRPKGYHPPITISVDANGNEIK